MQLLDVMHRLNSETEVSFLLTAYIETLRFYDSGGTLTAGVTALPLTGADDIHRRFETLIGIELDVGAARQDSGVHAMVREAVEVHGAALKRLQELAARPRPSPAQSTALKF